MLVDIVSRNGNLMLNFPLPNSGMLDAEELKILDEITRWMVVNSEGIYATRPWKVFGDGPVATAPPPAAGGRGNPFNERNRKDFTADEIRFTTKGNTLYAFVMGWPEKQAVVKALSSKSNIAPFKVTNVQLLGFKGKVKWTQDENGLTVEMPQQKPSDHAIALKVFGA
jgi:alpha-L-fucosidase